MVPVELHRVGQVDLLYSLSGSFYNGVRLQIQQLPYLLCHSFSILV